MEGIMHPASILSIPRISAALLLGAVLASNILTACNSDSGTTPPPASDALITLTSPQGGEKFKVGQVVPIKWTVKADPNDPMDEVDPMLSSDAGATWIFLRSGSIQIGSPSYGNFAWTIPDTVEDASGKYATAGKSWMLRVQSYNDSENPKKRSTTKTPFTISVAAP